MPLEDQRQAAAWIRRISAAEAELVVIDLPPQTGAATAAALIIADVFVVPIAPSSLDLRAASKALDMLRDARAERGDGKPAACWCPPRLTGGPAPAARSRPPCTRWESRLGRR